VGLPSAPVVVTSARAVSLAPRLPRPKPRQEKYNLTPFSPLFLLLFLLLRCDRFYCLGSPRIFWRDLSMVCSNPGQVFSTSSIAGIASRASGPISPRASAEKRAVSSFGYFFIA